MNRLYEDIYRYGKYYFPAQAHYNSNVVVHCDRCLKEDISACIGWEEHDLCLRCAADVNDIMNGEYIEEEIIYESE